MASRQPGQVRPPGVGSGSQHEWRVEVLPAGHDPGLPKVFVGRVREGHRLQGQLHNEHEEAHVETPFRERTQESQVPGFAAQGQGTGPRAQVE